MTEKEAELLDAAKFEALVGLKLLDPVGGELESRRWCRKSPGVCKFNKNCRYLTYRQCRLKLARLIVEEELRMLDW